MEKAYEIDFVNSFIKKNRKERLAYELSNHKKRKQALSRFCHNVLEIIDERKIICSGKEIGNAELSRYIKKYTNEKECYIISWDEDYDGKIMPVNIALEMVLSNGMAVLLIFKNLLIIEEEQEIGSPTRYILYNK